jgi:filamentous hemagglutinin
MIYNVDNRYLHHTDDLARVEKVEGELSKQVFDRNTYQQCVAGKCGGLGDEGGHLIASIFSGPGEKLNLVPMDGNLNKGAWRSMEKLWSTALDEGKTVAVKIEPIYDGAGVRPDRFDVTYQIAGKRPVSLEIPNVPGGR